MFQIGMVYTKILYLVLYANSFIIIKQYNHFYLTVYQTFTSTIVLPRTCVVWIPDCFFSLKLNVRR